ncbi:acriflavine resistance protein B [Shewanella sp. OPT22]|nr:acriflavine resistance protein B [Shewanella sp. OPT22]
MKPAHEQRGIIAWFASNPVAANLLMISVILLGVFSLSNLRKEAFPARESDTVTVSMTYNSGDASLSEEGIAVKIEEAVSSVQSIKRITSTSTASGTTVSIEKQSGYDLDILLRDVKNKVDGIYSFPADAEKPVVEKQQRLNHAYSLKLYGDTDRHTLQLLAERIKADLLAKPGISNITLTGKQEPLLSIEINEEKLQAFGLTLSDVATAINNESNVALSTSLRNASKTIILKASEQAHYQQEFAEIPLKTTAQGAIIRIGDVAKVERTFSDQNLALTRFNGEQGIGIEMQVDEAGDVIGIVRQADKVVKAWQQPGKLPQNVTLGTWDDGSLMIKDRLSLLIKNALSGIALVFLMLALFLNLRVALWVTAGLPFIFTGTLFFMSDGVLGMTINEMTTFGFILALGIVVDDAIVVGESIYDTRRKEGDSLASTIKGTLKVATPTIFGVLTTVVTFFALSNIEGGMGHVYSQFAVVVAICLGLSIVESKLILPSHLAHINTRKNEKPGRFSWARLQQGCDAGLTWVNRKLYVPLIQTAIQFRYAAVLIFIAIFITVINMPFNGAVRTTFFPHIPGSTIYAGLNMQNDASFGQTRSNLSAIEQAAIEADKQLIKEKGDDESGIGTLEVIASSDLAGSVKVELNEDAPYSDLDFEHKWKQIAGSLEGVRKLNIRSGWGGGDNFRVNLKAWDNKALIAAGKEFRQALSEIKGVNGIDDNFNSGQSQLKFELTEQGYALGMTTASLSRQLLQAFGGEIVQRYQLGKDEVKVRVRYPLASRQNVEDVMQARVRTPNGTIVPLSVVANVTAGYQQNSITRIDSLPAIYVTATADKSVISPNELVAKLKAELVPALTAKYPDLNIHFAGEAEQQEETTNSMTKLFILAMLAIYILLAIPLKSYIQPIIVMTAIPFGLVGAILGHWWNDMSLSILSFNGIVALSGVVVNDSLLLVTRINELRNQGMALKDAVFEACTGRLRPVLLTSLTTFAGLLPLLSETSGQAQFIIPAAASLGYGILFATVITLVLIPSLIIIQQDVAKLLSSLFGRFKPAEPAQV